MVRVLKVEAFVSEETPTRLLRIELIEESINQSLIADEAICGPTTSPSAERDGRQPIPRRKHSLLQTGFGIARMCPNDPDRVSTLRIATQSRTKRRLRLSLRVRTRRTD